jgi:hypothetical protein
MLIFPRLIPATLHNLHRLHADRHHLFDQAHNVFGIIGAVRVVGNAAAFVSFIFSTRQFRGISVLMIKLPVPTKGSKDMHVMRRFKIECVHGVNVQEGYGLCQVSFRWRTLHAVFIKD